MTKLAAERAAVVGAVYEYEECQALGGMPMSSAPTGAPAVLPFATFGSPRTGWRALEERAGLGCRHAKSNERGLVYPPDGPGAQSHAGGVPLQPHTTLLHKPKGALLPHT